MLKNDERILDYLGKRKTPVKTSDIVRYTGIPYQSVLRSLKRMKALGVVRSTFGSGNGHLYALAVHIPLESAPELAQSRPVDLLGALNVFQKHKLPRFVESGSYKLYAQAVAGIFKHAVSVMYGAVPDREELIFYRQGLEYYREQLEAHLRGVTSILETTEVWDEKINPQFLLGSLPVDLQEISDKVTRALEENK